MSKPSTPSDTPTWGTTGGSSQTAPGTGAPAPTASAGDDFGPALPPLELREGITIGTFVVRSELGAGATGIVLLAHDPELDRPVAIKLLHGDQHSAQAQQRLHREAQAAAKLSHPNVVAVHQVGTYAGRVYVVMEYVDGGTLRRWLERGRRSWQQIVEVYRQAGRGLGAAHRAGLVHRDFKPDNVLIGRDETDLRPRVTDFGLVSATPSAPVDMRAPELATLPVDASTRLTRTGAVLGTPAYMAPEQWAGTNVGPAADQFAFCVSLFEALYGHRPFAGATMPALAYAVTHGQLQPAPAGHGVPPSIHTAIMQGLATKPEDRHASMDALVDALDLGRAATGPGAATIAVAIAGAVLVLGGSVGTAVWWMTRDRDAAVEATDESTTACPDASIELDGIWGDDRRASVRAALAQGGRPYAQTVADTITAELDAFAKSWIATRDETCEVKAAEVDEATVARRRGCLDRSKLTLSVFVSMLDGSQGTVPLAGAFNAVDAIPPVTRCVDETVLAAMSEEVDPELWRRIVRAQLLTAAEAGAEAEPLAREAERAAEQAGSMPLRTRAAVALAGALLVQGKHDAALAQLDAAEKLARRADDPLTEADAVLHRILALSSAGRAPDAVALLEDARKLVSRVDDPWLRAQLSSAAGHVLVLTGNPEAGRTEMDEALAVYQRMDRGYPSSRAALLFSRGWASHQMQHFVQAERDYIEGIEAMERAAGRDYPKLGAMMLNLGSVLAHQGKVEDATARFERGLVLLRSADVVDPGQEGEALIGLGATELALGRRDAAREHLAEAHTKLSEAYGDRHPKSIDALARSGQATYESGMFTEAVSILEQARRVAIEGLGPDHIQIANIDTYLAGAYEGLGDYDAAIECAQRVVDLQRRVYGRQNRFVLVGLASLGDLYERSARCKQAIEHYREALAIRSTLGLPADAGLALPHAGWGMCALARRDLSTAHEHIDQAVEIVDRFDTPPPLRGRVWFAAAQLAARERDLDRARHLGEQAKTAFTEAGPPLRPLLEEVESWLGTLPG